MKMTPSNLVEIYERFEQSAAPIFKVEDGGSRFVRYHSLVNVGTTCWQSCWLHCIFPNLCVWHFAITGCRKLRH